MNESFGAVGNSLISPTTWKSIGAVLLVRSGLQPQPDEISGVQLVVLQRLGGEQHAVRGPLQGRHGLPDAAARGEGVQQGCCASDGGWIDAVDVLEVRPDVGEPVLDGFDGTDPGRLVDGLSDGRGKCCRRRRGDGDIGTDGEGDIERRLVVIGRREDGGGGGEPERDGETGRPPRNDLATSAQGRRLQLRRLARAVPREAAGASAQ